MSNTRKISMYCMARCVSISIPARDIIYRTRIFIFFLLHRLKHRIRFIQPGNISSVLAVSNRKILDAYVRVPLTYRSLSHHYRHIEHARFPTECSFVIRPKTKISIHEARFVEIRKKCFLDVGKQAGQRWRSLENNFPAHEASDAQLLLVPWGEGGASYGDFIIQVLPKLARLLRALGDEHLSRAHLCLPYFTRHSWAIQYLFFLGFKPDQIEDDSKTLTVSPGGILLVGTGPGSAHNIAHPADILELRERLGPHAPPDARAPFRRIYVSRKTGRKMINEESICKGLLEREFEIVFLEDMDVRQQSRIFAEAAMIVGPHGAGHANIIWSHPGTKLLELFSPHWMHPCYALLSTMLGLEYHCLVGYKGNETGGWSTYSRHGIFADIQIDPTVFFNKIDQLLKP